MANWGVGIDVGVKAGHEVAVVDEQQQLVLKARLQTDAGEFERLLAALEARAPAGTTFCFVLEPTGPVSKLVAHYLLGKGHRVFWAQPEQVKGMRTALGFRRRKTDRFDALALAKLPGARPRHLREAFRPADRRYEVLRRGAKRLHKLTKRLRQCTEALLALVDEAVPGLSEVLPDPADPVAQVVYRRWADPAKLARHTPERLAHALERQSGRRVDRDLAEQLVRVGRQALALGGLSACDRRELAAEIAADLQAFKLLDARVEKQKARNYALYKELDPARHMESLAGVGEVVAPIFQSLKPLVDRLRRPRQLRSFSGVVPKVDESGRRRRRLPMSKAGPADVRWAAYLAADRTRQSDPQLAAIYRKAMMEKGACHTKAVCALMSPLLDRVFCVLKEGRPYALRDLEGRPIAKAEARALAEALKVPEQVRRRLRRWARRPAERGPSRRQRHPVGGPTGPQRNLGPTSRVPA